MKLNIPVMTHRMKKMILKVNILSNLIFYYYYFFLDVGTVKSSVKYEVKGIDEEMKTIPDIEKKLEQMDENGDELDFDDDDEDIPDIGLNRKNSISRINIILFL
jgi:hypothetical protein